MDSFQYDPNTNRPVGLAYRVNASSAAFQVNTSLAWNANGSLQTMGYTDTNDSTKNQNCTYSADDLGRIASVGCGSSTWAQTFSYDSFGNINKAGQGNATSYSYAYTEGTNQVSGGPAYDANGNQLNSTGLSQILWNANGQPRSVTPLSGGAISGTFDALGRLVENGSGSAYTQFVFIPSGQKIASVQGGTLLKGTVPLPGGATAIYSGTSGMPYIRHLDWLGSSRLSTTWSHTVQSKVAYAPFGETYNEAGASSNDRSFTGQEQDTVTGNAATGIYDFLFRKYDPAAGRWLSPDPSGWDAVGPDDPQSLDRYAYLTNRPMSLLDPYGLDCASYDNNGNLVSISQGDCPGKDPNNEFYIPCDGCTVGYVPGSAQLDDNGDFLGFCASAGCLDASGNPVPNFERDTIAPFDPVTITLDYITSSWQLVQGYFTDSGAGYSRLGKDIGDCFWNEGRPAIADAINPFSTGGTGLSDATPDAVKAGLTVSSAYLYNKALSHAIDRGLTTPLRSDIYRGLMEKSASLGEAAEGPATVGVTALWMGVIGEAKGCN